MKVMMQLDTDELKALQTGVVVEMYPHVIGRSGKCSGSKRRRYHAEFNEAERKKIWALHQLFHKWHIGGTETDINGYCQYRGGIPETHTFALVTLNFIQRVVHFFGTL